MIGVKWSYRIGSIRGMPIRLHVTFLAILLVFIWVFKVQDHKIEEYGVIISFGGMDAPMMRDVIAFYNIILGIFNLIPAFPMDGGGYFALSFYSLTQRRKGAETQRCDVGTRNYYTYEGYCHRPYKPSELGIFVYNY